MIRFRFPIPGFPLTLALSSLFLILFLTAGCGGARKGGLSTDQCKSGQIIVQGESPVYGDMSMARGRAKEDACRIAVEKCIGVQISGYSAVQDAESVASEIYSQANAICSDDELISESTYPLEDIQMLKTKWKFQVSEVSLQSKIDTMLKVVGNPRIMILAREEYNIPGGQRVVGFASRNSVSAGILQEYLVQSGYTVVDPARANPGSLNESAIIQQLSEQKYGETDSIGGAFNDFKDRAAQAGADVLVIGRVTATKQNLSKIDRDAFDVGLHSYQANGNFTIVALWGRGELMGQLFARPTGGAHTTDQGAASEAIRRFTIGSDRDPFRRPANIARDLKMRLSEKWSELSRNNKIYMQVSGLDQRHMAIFREDIAERTAARKVDEIEFSGNAAKWEVTYPGRSFALADRLSFYANDPRMFVAVARSGKRLSVDVVKRGEIHVSFR